MAPIRPILARYVADSGVAATRADEHLVGELLPRQVQVAIVGDGPMSRRRLEPLTPAARELLSGPRRHAADRVLRGLLGALDGSEGAANLRGLSLSTDVAAFAANLVLSNVEAGFFPDTVAAGEVGGFERNLARVAPSARDGKAQNTGWMDVGPRVSSLLLDLVDHGERAGTRAAHEVALTALHELQHSITPPDPNTITDRHVWLEEGIAETLAWWPGAVTGTLAAMGLPAAARTQPDPWTADPETTAGADYRRHHRSVLGLLSLAGVDVLRADGSVDPAGRERAARLLQGRTVERVPRSLARAIADRHGLEHDDEVAVRELILDTDGAPEAVATLRELLEAARRQVSPPS